MIKVVLVSIVVGIPLLLLFLMIPYTYYLCVRYIKEHNR